MINERIENILNTQINKEFYSAYLYLAMSAYFEEIGLFGFAHWTRVQAKEEVDHGMIIFEYIIERDGKVQLMQINSPESSFNGVIDVVEKIHEHEKSITADINTVTTQSENECDFATRNFIDWYVSEQVEEEANARDILNKLKMFGDDKSALYHIDAELASRVYVPHTYTA